MHQSGGMGDMRTMMKFQQRLQAMTQEELVAALDEIAALDLPAESRHMLEQMLLGPLAKKDPEFALTKFIDHIQENGMMSWQLANAMQEWAKKDPTAAIGWFDRQIAAGKFDSKSLDGKSQTRLQFEGNLINILLGSDPEAAGRRLARTARGPAGRGVVPVFLPEPLKEERAARIRQTRPRPDSRKRPGQDTRPTGNPHRCGDDGYSKVTEFLDRIQATPAERTACVEQAAESKLQIISFRKKSPARISTPCANGSPPKPRNPPAAVTGKVLANATQAGRKMEFSEAAALADNTTTPAATTKCSHPFSKAGPRGKTRTKPASSPKKFPM